MLQKQDNLGAANRCAVQILLTKGKENVEGSSMLLGGKSEAQILEHVQFQPRQLFEAISWLTEILEQMEKEAPNKSRP